MTFYHQKQADELQKKLILILLGIISSFALSLTACVLLCVFAQNDSAGVVAATIILFTLGGWISISLYYALYRPAKKKRGFILAILNGEKQHISATVSVISPTVTLQNGLRVTPITFMERRPITLYLESSKMVFTIGMHVNITAVNGFITECQVTNEKSA